MAKVTGVKSVDFKITAYGYGVVNWNGPTFMGYNGSIKILQKFKIEIKRLQLK